MFIGGIQSKPGGQGCEVSLSQTGREQEELGFSVEGEHRMMRVVLEPADFP